MNQRNDKIDITQYDKKWISYHRLLKIKIALGIIVANVFDHGSQ
jgi:hypothetical protein